MATLDEIGAALKKAAAAGDTAAATKLAAAYKAMKAQQAAPPAQAAAPAPPAAPGAGPTDYLSQGLSGLNEGIASGLGAPVDLMTMLLNGGSMGVNALAHTNIPMIENPVGGAGTFRSLLSPTIKPESSDPALQVTRRIGQEVGAWALPGMGPIAKSAKPLQTFGRELMGAVGSGTGAAVAQQVAPGNPIAEMVGQIAGGVTPGNIARMAERRGVPKVNIDDLRTAKTAAYDAVDRLGVAYSPSAYDNMLRNVVTEAQSQHMSPTRHADAYSFIKDMVDRRGKPMTLTELDQLRQEVRRDLILPSYGNTGKAADAHFGQIILDQIDGMISKAGPGDIVGGNAKDGANAILLARSANATYRKSEVLSDALYRARLQTESTGSGGNINNAVRQQIRAILTNPKKRKAFNADEVAMMESLVKQGKLENLLRWVGKFSPGGNGLIGMLQVGTTVLNPAMAALPVAGMVAKGMADAGTLKKVDKLQQTVARTGSWAPRPPVVPSAALIAGQIASQSGAR